MYVFVCIASAASWVLVTGAAPLARRSFFSASVVGSGVVLAGGAPTTKDVWKIRLRGPIVSLDTSPLVYFVRQEAVVLVVVAPSLQIFPADVPTNITGSVVGITKTLSPG